MAKTFYIIDDHEMLRLGTRSWITENSDWVCAGDAGTHDAAYADFEKMAVNSESGAGSGGLPSVLICDLNFYGENTGFDFIAKIHAKYPDVKIVVYSMFFAAGIVQNAVRNGASGYVSKNASSAELLNSLEKVRVGEVFIQEELKTDLIKYNNFTDALTRREKEVMELLLRRCSNDDIADRLNIKKRAVENYISAIYEKTGVNDRAEFIAKFGV